ncbi:MAG: MerR family transcriptional regulator [Spirochaetota bacterium]
MNERSTYSVSALARIAGVSVRTLHHYDRIGLLSPSARTASGYRVYGEAELLRLQEVLLYRELEFPLEEIRDLLDSPDHDPVQALVGHRHSIEEKTERLLVLLSTIDKTIAHLGGEGTMLSDEELYEGFGKKEIEAIKAETIGLWGKTEAYNESQKRVAKMGKAQWARVKEEGHLLETDCAAAFKGGRAPDSPEAMKLMARKAIWLRHFYEPSAGIFSGLGEMYAADERFRAAYDRYAVGLADWLKLAMGAFAGNGMRTG